MNYTQKPVISFDSLLTGTFAELSQIKREIGFYFLFFAGLGAVQWLVESYAIGLRGFVSIFAFFAYFYAQYRLYQASLSSYGALPHDRVRVFSFLGMALLIGAGLAFASNFLVIPAIILGGKWIMAPTFLVARDRAVLSSIGDSWDASSGNTLALSLAYGLIFFGWLVLIGLGDSLSDALNLPSGYNAVSGLILHILPILLMGMSVTAYRQLANPADTLANVFE